MPTAVMRMLVDPSSGISPKTAERAYVSGIDQIPWPSRSRLKDNELSIERSVSESGKVHVPFVVAGRGEVMLSTGTLMQRERPYQLEIELARGKLNQVRNQVAEWQALGLVVPQPVDAALRGAIEQFGAAVTVQDRPAEAADRARHAIAASLETADLVADCYIEQALAQRHRLTPRLPLLLGLRLEKRLLPQAALAHLMTAFNMVSVPLTWRNVEAIEGDFQWSIYDNQIDWFRAHGVYVAAGPLLQFDNLGVPDWLALWEGDFENLLHFAGEYVAAVVGRYRGKVAVWHVAARVNSGDVLGLQEEQKMQLAVRVLEVARKHDPQTPSVICFDQPWGEYLRKTDSALSPLHFADALVRSGLQLGGIGLEINLGYLPCGTSPRDRIDFSRMLDLWSMLGLPLHILLTVPSSDQPDPKARPGTSTNVTGYWTPEAQAAWARRYLPIIFAKGYVQTVVWNQFCDADPHDYPHGGLFDAATAAKPAFTALAQLRKKHLP